MENFINASQNFLNNQGGGGQGGQQGNQQGGGGFDIGSLAGLVSHAQNHDQNGSGNEQLFSQCASFLQSRAGNVNGNIDEQQLLQNHDQVNNGSNPVDSNQIGGAAALGAIKNILGGSGGGGNQGDLQQKMIGAAMAQAGNLFDQKQQQGQTAGGSKEDAMNSAGEAVMKLMVKHQMSSMIGGGSSGGLGSLMSMLG